MTARIVDITDEASFRLLPPCADERFDHRTCDYWEDADRGTKLHRPGWLKPDRAPAPARSLPPDNPFAPSPEEAHNPFLPSARASLPPTFADDDLFATPLDNPFAPVTRRERPLLEGVPRKLALLDRGRGVFGSYAKVLLVENEPVAYCQFGPLSAYPRAQRLRELYSQLPEAPLPAVITCIASRGGERGQGHARQLVDAVCTDLAERGFAAVEAYPDLTRGEDEQSGARPAFWHGLGFTTAVDDERFPVVRREL
ncbi:MAG TPA: GNAT family N-acetyltransferase [Candidatus Limnocylindrales bacterium]|nr:GNAT family N-acetyltransferase [Candidatus Limnocylindrales bacterium]